MFYKISNTAEVKSVGRSFPQSLTMSESYDHERKNSVSDLYECRK